MLGVTPAAWSGPADWVGALLAQPAMCTVPAAFLTMIGVSLATRDRLPAHLASTMVRLHAPEALDLDRGGFLPVAERGR
jgi:hypothetical protein